MLMRGMNSELTPFRLDGNSLLARLVTICPFLRPTAIPSGAVERAEARKEDIDQVNRDRRKKQRGMAD